MLITAEVLCVNLSWGRLKRHPTRHHRAIITILPTWLFRLSRAGKQLLSQVLDCCIWRLLSNRQPRKTPNLQKN